MADQRAMSRQILDINPGTLRKRMKKLEFRMEGKLASSA
jgi:hypothetical protein